jgi:hypothetical protein
VRGVLGRWCRRGLAVGVVLAASCGDDDSSRIVEGVTVGVASSGVGIGLDEGDGAGEGYAVGNGVEWIGTDNRTHESGQPECLPPMSSGAEVVLHLVRYGSREHVVRVECLTLPSELDAEGASDLSAFHSYCAALGLEVRTPPLAANATDPCGEP